MTRYAVLSGFGLFDGSNKEYKRHLDGLVRLVKSKRIDEVVLCGGYTDISAPERSEAQSMADYLRPVLGKDIKIHIEDRSITSEQNVKLAKDFIDLDEKNRIFLIADAVRFPKVMWFVLHDWFGLSKEQITDYWFDLVKRVYENPKKKETTMELKDIRPLLFYKNVRIIVDSNHKDYKSAMHNLISEPLEIEALYDQRAYDKFIELTKKKFKMR